MTRVPHTTWYRRSRTSLAWGLFAFVLAQLGLDVAMERWRPVLRDPEYGYKLMRLRACLAAHPGRPLILVLGSSRTALGLRPERLSETEVPSEPAPVVFNFAMNGAGPVLELITLQRILADGIRPQDVVFEVHPVLLHQDGGWDEEAWVNINRLGFQDVRTFVHYSQQPLQMGRHWVRSRLTPAFSHRFSIMTWYAPSWLPFGSREDGWANLDGWGWHPYPKTDRSSEAYRSAVAFARSQYGEPLRTFRISAVPDRALRQALELCRRERVDAHLLLMPEGSEFQSWYPAHAVAAVDAYLTELCRTYHVPLVDARRWLADDLFCDSHHLWPEGADQFTRRFGREVVRPLAEARARREQPTAETRRAGNPRPVSN